MPMSELSDIESALIGWQGTMETETKGQDECVNCSYWERRPSRVLEGIRIQIQIQVHHASSLHLHSHPSHQSINQSIDRSIVGARDKRQRDRGPPAPCQIAWLFSCPSHPTTFWLCWPGLLTRDGGRPTEREEAPPLKTLSLPPSQPPPLGSRHQLYPLQSLHPLLCAPTA
ncbi:hypothetical protein BO78DRAFT_93297 [Aspergillus sclerotiicarbonarius CBS 121057]|uniref:Uncharacterized protein n=1 Tax=Aspergillus sclerotiicarbonarius (strain CBS 121057 / IBT 28362) TaxID=1448318 RepID=A0A319EKN0_ASPSB|nr:hypothetical protein BO78DRAFT_93297 [Aspergillus sclerotiicarbonarius CBS 121057]